MADDFGPILPAPAADTFVFDFAPQIGGVGTIASAAWLCSVDPASVVHDTAPMTRILSTPVFSGTKTSALIGNMVNGCLYILRATVTMSDARVLSESASLLCTSAEGPIAFTVGALIAEARQMLNDVVPISGSARYTDAALVSALNEGMLQVRAKRPDAFLRFGLRKTTPVYALPADAGTEFPIEDQFYSPLLFYVVGRSELTEDTFSDDNRAVTLMGKFTAQLLKAAS